MRLSAVLRSISHRTGQPLAALKAAAKDAEDELDNDSDDDSNEDKRSEAAKNGFPGNERAAKTGRGPNWDQMNSGTVSDDNMSNGRTVHAAGDGHGELDSHSDFADQGDDSPSSEHQALGASFKAMMKAFDSFNARLDSQDQKIDKLAEVLQGVSRQAVKPPSLGKAVEPAAIELNKAATLSRTIESLRDHGEISFGEWAQAKAMVGLMSSSDPASLENLKGRMQLASPRVRSMFEGLV